MVEMRAGQRARCSFEIIPIILLQSFCCLVADTAGRRHTVRGASSYAIRARQANGSHPSLLQSGKPARSGTLATNNHDE
jgi:hypothetical protein